MAWSADGSAARTPPTRPRSTTRGEGGGPNSTKVRYPCRMLLLVLLRSAHAYDSEAQPVLLRDEAELFSIVEFSSGYLPAGSPVAVEFRVEANGGAGVEMEGEGTMSWPAPLTVGFTPDVGSGIYVLDASLDAVTSVVVDLSDWGYYGEIEIDRRSVTMDATRFFDPYVLDSRIEVVDTLDVFPIVSYSYEIFPTVSLNFDAELAPVVTAGFEGVHWSANGATITAESGTTQLPPERTGNFGVEAVFRALWDARLDLVISPTFSVSAPFVGDIEIVDLDIPIQLLTEGFEQDFPAIDLGFPLPLLETGVTSADFVGVAVGAIANVQVPLRNTGELEAYGTATIEGDAAFSVYPTTFNALPGTEDGVVVTFTPPAEGAYTANLVLSSNDPTYPDLIIPLSAGAVESDVGRDVGDTGEVKADVSTCGCAAASGGGGALGAFTLALGAVVLRRRRGPTA
jgi:MYXO-CTERM domain-containing protein